MDLTDYRPRVTDALLNSRLELFGAVCIEGPKWCGKTWSGLRHANSVFDLASPENAFQIDRCTRITQTEANIVYYFIEVFLKERHYS